MFQEAKNSGDTIQSNPGTQRVKHAPRRAARAKADTLEHLRKPSWDFLRNRAPSGGWELTKRRKRKGQWEG